MAFKSRKRKHQTGDLDLLPFMNLFSILIPFLLSVAVFEKLGILELNLPERSPEQPDKAPAPPDPMNLNLTFIVTDDFLTVGASGGFLPKFHYQQVIDYRSDSDGHTFTEVYEEGKEVKSPTDGKVMTPHEREKIHAYYVVKEDSADPGEHVMVAKNSLNEPMLDTTGEFYTRLPASGELYQIVGDAEVRKMTPRELSFCKMGRLSAYDEVARSLWQIRNQALNRDTPPEDIDKITILAGEKVIYDKIIKAMDASKYAGFHQQSLSLLGG